MNDKKYQKMYNKYCNKQRDVGLLPFPFVMWYRKYVDKRISYRNDTESKSYNPCTSGSSWKFDPFWH